MRLQPSGGETRGRARFTSNSDVLITTPPLLHAKWPITWGVPECNICLDAIKTHWAIHQRREIRTIEPDSGKHMLKKKVKQQYVVQSQAKNQRGRPMNREEASEPFRTMVSTTTESGTTCHLKKRKLFGGTFSFLPHCKKKMVMGHPHRLA